MSAVDCIGFIGVLLILIAFFLNLIGALDSDHIIYILLNLCGASLACLASILMKYMPFVLLEGTWTLVSFLALIKYCIDGKTNWRKGIKDIDSKHGARTE